MRPRTLLCGLLFVPLLLGSSRVHERARLAVVLVVDGLSADRLDAVRPALTGGLKRLLDEGAVATACSYGNLNTETAPGHATIATGATPSVHGVPSNAWYALAPDGTAMIRIPAASQPFPGEAETSAKTQPGPGRLRIPTLGDRLLAHDSRTRVVSISVKDRAAILMAGRDPRAAAYWYDAQSGRFVTSPSHAAESPTGARVRAVVERIDRESGIEERLGRTWERLRPSPGASAVGVDVGVEDRQYEVVGRGFPKTLGSKEMPYRSALPWTPKADRLLADLAVALIDDRALALGRDDAPDVLWVSFSANDYVSHAYGPGSLEDLDLLRRLDLEVGRLLDALDRCVGRGRFAVAFTADHGFLPLPESTRVHGAREAGRRLDVEAMRRGLNAVVDRELGLDPATELVFRIEGCDLWLDRAALGRRGAPDPHRVLAVVERELATTWSESVEAAEIEHANATRVVGRSGDLSVVPRYGVLFDTSDGKGTSHGSPHDYDAHVPLVFWGAGIARATIEAPVTPCDLAPTLAAIFGVSLPDATGHSILTGRRARQRPIRAKSSS